MDLEMDSLDLETAAPEVRRLVRRFRRSARPLLLRDGRRVVAALLHPAQVRVAAAAREDLLVMLQKVAARNDDADASEIAGEVAEAIGVVRGRA